MKVFLLQIQLNKRFYESKAYQDFRKYFQIIEDVIEEGKLDGCFRSDINTRVFRNMFLGAFNHIGLRWLILSKDEEYDKMQEINQVTDLLCSAVLASENE